MSNDSDECEAEAYFHFSATLRIFGETVDFDEVSANLRLTPTRTHRRGERRGLEFAPYEHDMWSYSPSIPEEAPLSEHVDALWDLLKPKRDYLLELKRTTNVDVFLGYRSNSYTAGFDLPWQSLEMFTVLKCPFGLSIVASGEVF